MPSAGSWSTLASNDQERDFEDPDGTNRAMLLQRVDLARKPPRLRLLLSDCHPGPECIGRFHFAWRQACREQSSGLLSLEHLLPHRRRAAVGEWSPRSPSGSLGPPRSFTRVRTSRTENGGRISGVASGYMPGIFAHGVKRIVGQPSRVLSLPEEPLPRGVILGSVELVDCIDDAESAWALRGSFHWVMRRPKLLARPVAHTGNLGFHRPAHLRPPRPGAALLAQLRMTRLCGPLFRRPRGFR
jgi:hypothetical protein